MEGVLAEAEGRLMVFRLHLIGAAPLELEIDASGIRELSEIISRQRFVEGRLTQPDGDGVLAGALIATSRIQCVIESS
jgi:hypothetical protein